MKDGELKFKKGDWLTIIQNKLFPEEHFYDQFIGEAFPILKVKRDGRYVLATYIKGAIGPGYHWWQDEVRAATKKEIEKGMERMVAEKV